MHVERLTFGYHAGLPDEATVAWGARAILCAGGHLDLLPDRVSWLGDDPIKCESLSARLHDGVLDAVRNRVRQLWNEGVIDPRRRREVVLLEADDVVVKGNTNASCGYFYLVAYARPGGGA